MRNKVLSENAIRGSCSLFVCRCCRTKYGWEHQEWCDLSALTQPSCKECRYFRERDGECVHPAKKPWKEELPYEEAQCPI